MFQLIAILLAFIVVKKIISIRQMYVCVSDQDIRDYFEGRLKKRDKEQYEKTIAHLGVCEKCQEKLESFVHSKPGEDEITDHLVEN